MTEFRLAVRYQRAAVQLYDCVSFRFAKERYTPYTTLSGEWYCPENMNMSEIMTLIFYADGAIIHNGFPASAQILKKDGRTALRITSYGYSMALTSNQCPDGLIENVNLTELISKAGFTLPNVTYQQNTPSVNYVNYYNGTSLWDGIVSYSLRAATAFPYLRGANEIRVSPPEDQKEILTESSELISRSSETDYSKIISRISMKPIDGEGEGYSYANSLAARKNIVRCKEIPFDREWIMDPLEGLKSRVDYSMRGFLANGYTLYGYQSADILDRISVTDLRADSEISAITVSGTAAKGVQTEIWCYFDGYCN